MHDKEASQQVLATGSGAARRSYMTEVHSRINSIRERVATAAVVLGNSADELLGEVPDTRDASTPTAEVQLPVSSGSLGQLFAMIEGLSYTVSLLERQVSRYQGVA